MDKPLILDKIILQGFLSYKNKTVVDFSNRHTIMISGKTGTGKSSLFESILVGFYGKYAGRGETLDEYINEESKYARIVIFFRMRNNRYKKVMMFGEKSANELYIYDFKNSKWNVLTGDDKLDTNQIVKKLIGLSYKTFKSSVYFDQKGSFQFINGDPAERKEILQELLDLEIYEVARKISKEKADVIDTERNSKMNIISMYQQEVDKEEETKDSLNEVLNDINTINNEIEKINADIIIKEEEFDSLNKLYESQKEILEIINENDKNLHLKYNNIEKKENQIQKLNDDIKNLNVKIQNKLNEEQNNKEKLEKCNNDKQENIKKIEKINQIFTEMDISNLKVKYQKINDKNNEVNAEIKVIKSKNSSIDIEIKKMQNNKTGICPIINEECNRISSESIEKLILERQNIKFQNDQKVIELKNYANENTEKLEKINKLIEKHDSLANSKNTLLNNNNVLDVNLTNYQSLLSKIPDSINEYKYEIEKSNQKINELQNEIEQLKIDIEDLENDITKLNNKINKDIEKPTKKEIDNLISKRIEKNKIELDFVKKQGMLENKLSNIMKYKNDIIDAKNQIEILNVKLKKYQDVIEVCGKNGYQKAKMKAIVPLLEIKSNELVKQFTQNDNLSIKFDLDPKTKSGKLKKCGGLEIIIQNGNNERKLNMYSGGETVIITFSILLSLAEILSERRGSKLKTLIIDERISGLDNENINQFIEVINKISSKFERIIVISHITEILSAFDDSIIIEKNENGSYIVE